MKNSIKLILMAILAFGLMLVEYFYHVISKIFQNNFFFIVIFAFFFMAIIFFTDVISTLKNRKFFNRYAIKRNDENKVLSVMSESPQGLTLNQLKRKDDLKGLDVKEIVERLKKRNLIIERQNKLFFKEKEGTEYFDKWHVNVGNADQERVNMNLKLILEFVTLLILLFQAFIAFNQANLESRIFNLEQTANIPNAAEIVVQTYHHSMSDIMGGSNVSDIPVIKKSEVCRDPPLKDALTILFQNKGRLDSGPINLRLSSPDFQIDYVNGDESAFAQNIKAAETKITEFKIYGKKDFCNSTQTNSTFLLRYDCIFCEGQHNFNKTIEVNIIP